MTEPIAIGGAEAVEARRYAALAESIVARLTGQHGLDRRLLAVSLLVTSINMLIEQDGEDETAHLLSALGHRLTDPQALAENA